MRSPGPGSERAAARAGVTLLELLLVMGLLGLVLGAGLGIFATRDAVAPIAPGVVRSALRNAQILAQLERAPVSVEWDAETSGLRVRAPRTVGTWHFEPQGALSARGEQGAAGASALRQVDPIPGVLRGAEWVEPAFIGTGIDLRSRNATWGVPLNLYPQFGFEEGLAISVAIRPEAAFDGVIWSLGSLAGIEYRRSGGLTAWVTPRAEDDPTGTRLGGRVETVLPARTVPIGRWTTVEVLYDLVELRVVVDGFPAAIVPLEDPLPRLQSPLVIGDRKRAFVGLVDSLVVRSYRAEDPLELPEGQLWPADAPTRVRFDADGTLDRRLHPEPLTLDFETAPGQIQALQVTRYGTVE